MIADGSQKGLSEEFIVQFFKAIHQESITHQEKIFNS
jgi:chorismate mutase